MTADGSAQPILAMQSSVSPLHGLSPCDVAVFIIAAHSSLICDAVTAALDMAGADAKATSWAKRPTIAPKSSIRESQRLTIKYCSLAEPPSMRIAMRNIAFVRESAG